VASSSGSPIVIGAGHNGLTAAFYLARAGLTPLVLERQPVVGGAATTEEIAPGYRCPALAHAIGPVRSSVARAMQLERRGIEFVRPDPRLVALAVDGPALVFSIDRGRTADAIRAFSSVDAARYESFCGTLERLGAFVSVLLHETPPSLDATRPAELWEWLKLGRRFRALGKVDGYRLLRWGPMAVADLVAEWFETDLLQSAIAARGIFGMSQGPWSAGTTAALLLNAAYDAAPGGSSVTVKGGPQALALAMRDAACEQGAAVRLSSRVTKVLVRDNRISGIALADGSEIAADAVISSADPRRTFLSLMDPVDLDPTFVSKVRNYRCTGSAAKVNLTLARMPSFTGITDTAMLRGRVHIGPTVDYLERAFDASKYGEISAEPYLDITIPSLNDSAFAATGRHVMSVHVQFAPYRLAGAQGWDQRRGALLEQVVAMLDRYAPGCSSVVEASQVLTPVDLEREYSLSGGHLFHGEQALDQTFTMRPFLGCARYRGPVTGLYLCGAGTHPGGPLAGASGDNAAREVLSSIPNP
jgi:phytoene dehydrogenase-like protein